MLEQRIQQQFFESADLKYQAAEVLGRPIEQAVAALVAGLTAGGRVLVAGLGASASLAQLVTAELIGCFERDRPGLAALALGVDGPALSAMAVLPGASFDTVLSRQVETLGQPGDLLLLIDSDGNHPALLAAVAATQGAAGAAGEGDHGHVLALRGGHRRRPAWRAGRDRRAGGRAARPPRARAGNPPAGAALPV